MKTLVSTIAVTVLVLSFLTFSTDAFSCYLCSDCSDPLDQCLATVEVCNETGSACSVRIFQFISFKL